MPYIENKDRVVLEADLRNLFSSMGELEEGLGAGTLNYIFTRVSLEYLRQKGLRYKFLNDISGALSCADKEVYRRLSAKYEDATIEKNGDVEEFEQFKHIYKGAKVHSVS